MVADYSGIAPGHYVLRQFGIQGESTGTATVDLTTNQPVDLASTAATAASTSRAKSPMPPATCSPAKPGSLSYPSKVAKLAIPSSQKVTESFTSIPLQPARMTFMSARRMLIISILQMMATGADVQGNRITVAGQPVLLAATLARGATTVTGYAAQRGKRTGGVMILLVPRNAALHDLYRRDQSNTDGSFTLNRVVPGDYTLVAIDNGWTLEWARPEVIAPYLTRGVHVRVTDQHTLELPAPVEVQPR